MKAPQIITICLMNFGLIWALVKDGKPKEGNYSFIETLVGTLINIALLYWGGFFGRG